MSILHLLDIDGTLIDSNIYHIRAFQHAFKQVLHLDMPDQDILKHFGKPGYHFLSDLLAEHGLQYSPDLADRLKPFHNQFFRDAIDRQGSIPLLPGAEEYISEIKARNHHCGIATGNSTTCGSKILNAAKYNGQPLMWAFDVHSFGQYTIIKEGRVEILRVTSRSCIVQDAIDTAAKRGFKFKDVFVVGDTPSDIEAAHAYRSSAYDVYAVAVPTGSHPRESLLSADIVLKDLTEYKKIFEFAESH